MSITPFKLAGIQVEEIDTCLQNLKLLCEMYRVPMFATIAKQNTVNETRYLRITYAPESHGIHLFDDQIRKHQLVSTGFEVVMKRQLETEDMDDPDELSEEI